MTIADDDIFLADVETAEASLHFSGGLDDSPLPYQTGASDTPASTDYDPRLQQVAMLARSMFGDRTTRGRSQVSVGDVILRNEDFGLDKYKRYAFDGRRIVVYRGQPGAAYPAAFTPVLDATMTTPTWDGSVSLKARDNQKYLDVPLQTTTYAGDNVAPDGLEGTPDDLKGKLKPVCVCGATNISPPCVNAPKLIYQVHDGEVHSIVEVRDRGAALLSGIGGFTFRTSGFGADDINGLAYGAGLFVAVGNAGKLFTSPDGETWTSRTSQFGSDNIEGIGYDATLGFVAVGGAGKISTSTTGTLWTAQTSGVAVTLRAVAFRNASMIIVGGDGPTLITSPTGVTWTSRNPAVSSGILSLACNSLGHVVVGATGQYGYSSDGVLYSANSGPFISGIGALSATSDDYFVAGELTAPSGRLWRAIDTTGYTWESVGALPGSFVDFFVLGGGYILAAARGGGPNIAWSIDGGKSWSQATTAGGAVALFCAAYGNGTFVVAGSGGVLYTTSTSDDYADTAELLNDSLAPAPGTYKVYNGSAGGGAYFRLGSSPNAAPTCDVLQGATAADRTAANAFVIANERAGNVAGDWSASDITALDATDSSEIEFWAGPDDVGVMCSDVADAAARTVGAGWWADTSGVLRIRQLAAPDPNLVTNPDTITAGAGWTMGGTAAGAAGFSNIGGVPFTRITDADTGVVSRAVALTGNTTKRFAIELQFDVAAGDIIVGLYDATAAAYLAAAHVVFAADGTAIASVSVGSIVRFFPVGADAYALVMDSVAANAAHSHLVVPVASSTATSLRIGRVTVYDSTTPLALDQNDLDPPLTPLPSNDENGGIPPWKTTLRYARNHTVQTDNLAGIVSDADRVFYGLEWREAVSEDSAVLTRHPLSQPASVETLYRDEADAIAEVTRRQALNGADHEWYECGVKMTTETVTLDLGDVVEIADQRFGIGPAARFRILGIRPEIRTVKSRILLTLWR